VRPYHPPFLAPWRNDRGQRQKVQLPTIPPFLAPWRNDRGQRQKVQPPTIPPFLARSAGEEGGLGGKVRAAKPAPQHQR